MRALTIVELGDAKELKWADVKTPDVSISLTLENTTTRALKDARIDVTPFATASQSVQVSVNDTPNGFPLPTIAAGARVPITLKATLTAGGTYRSRLTVRQRSKTLASVPLEIGRSRVAAPIEMTTAPAQTVALWPGSSGSAAFRIELTGAGETITLDTPVKKSIEFRETADAKTALTAADIDVSFTTPSPLTVSATPQPVEITVHKIGTPGRYDVVVGFGGPAYATATTTFTVYARQSALVAAGCISIGLALSWLIRYYSGIRRPLLQNKERAARLFSELDEDARLAHGDAPALALVQDVRRALIERWETLSRDGKLTDGTALDIDAQKIATLPVWLQLWARAGRIHPATVGDEFRSQLRDVETILRDRGADAKAIDAQATALAGMPAAMDRKIIATLGPQIDEVASRAVRDSRLASIVADARQLKERLAAPEAIDHLQEIAAEVERLRLRYFTAAADDLTRRVAAPPDWAGASWMTFAAAIDATLAHVRAATSAAAAASAYRDALTTYVRGVIDGLLLDIAERTGDSGDGSGKSPYAAEYKVVQEKLKSIPAIVDRGDIAAAWDRLREALDAYNDIRAKARGKSMGSGTAAGALGGMSAPIAGDFDVVSVFPGGSPVDAVNRPGAYGLFVSERRRWDIMVSLVIAVAAVLAGLQALWVDNSTWGGGRSMLAALLWGLAFDQFSYAGLVALIKRK